ncbi:protein phosphatase 2C domain-containing protein [Nocardiopsis sp. CC223A]|uniref:protein phosphatase 2C domain-containing protein n=1 Tax=Nocardiopsis sp. CC223A TaxID=3044051 RepID=UPI00278C6C08|nr:protein phosphatase 2C domain-containing protein [Nocardiopsis sp. CC223A]
MRDGPFETPEPLTDTTNWYFSDPGVHAWGVWTEKVPGAGEDAEPLCEHHPSGGVIGVFDGAGGAGGAQADRDRQDRRRTGAWIASRTAALAVKEWFRAEAVGAEVSRSEVESLETRVGDYLRAMRPRERSRISGSMVRQLPTTMAAVTYRLEERHVVAHTLWAGDSRVYLLSPQDGLMALTRDHTEEQDALAQLREDPPMDNLLHASGRFRVDSERVDLRQPCILLCATDGVFGYLPTPHLVELLLLESLEHSPQPQDLSAEIERRIRSHTGDDATLAAVALGFADFDEVRSMFRDRLHEMRREFGGHPPGGTREEERRWCEDAWRRYRGTYESRLSPLREERDEAR